MSFLEKNLEAYNEIAFFPGTGLTCTHEFTFNSNHEAWNLDS